MRLVAGLFGHPRHDDSLASAWYHGALGWMGAHWAVLAVVIPVAGGLAGGIVNHYLAVARENRSRALNRKDVRARVYADLAARLLRHCAWLQQTMASGSLDVTNWRNGNAGLHARAESPDVVEALGPDYVAFMAAIECERRAIGNDGPRATLERYLPFIAAFGEGAQARRLQKLLRRR